MCVCGFIQVSEEEERVKHAGRSAFTLGPSDHPPWDSYKTIKTSKDTHTYWTCSSHQTQSVSQSEKSFVSICQQLVCKRWAGYQTSALSWELAEMCLEKQSTQIWQWLSHSILCIVYLSFDHTLMTMLSFAKQHEAQCTAGWWECREFCRIQTKPQKLLNGFYNSSWGEHLYQITWKSIQYLFTYFKQNHQCPPQEWFCFHCYIIHSLSKFQNISS